MNLILTGFMGTGKTVVGKRLAELLGMEFVDSDDIIEESEGTSISEIFSQKGEPYFRDRETRVIKKLAKLDNKIIATGGGVVLRNENMDVLEENGKIICLSASPEVVFQRTSKTNQRPLLRKQSDTLKKIKNLLTFRAPYYKRADYSIDTSELEVEQIVQQILKFWKG